MAESMWLHTHLIDDLIDDLISVGGDTFKVSVRYVWPTVPTYPSGVIGFLLCSKEGSPVDFLNPLEKVEGAINHKRDLRLDNSEIHSASFASPTFLEGTEVSVIPTEMKWKKQILKSTTYVFVSIMARCEAISGCYTYQEENGSYQEK